MSRNNDKTVDTFDRGTCSVCGSCEVNQYFSVSDHFIRYDGTFLSLREVLISALDFKITSEDSKSTEICIDCKDKVVKFYHFKKKANETQKRKLQTTQHQFPKKEKRKSKIVHSIIDIVETYTQKCAITSIEIDENSKKLTIVPAEEDSKVSASNASSNFSFSDVLNVTVKEEPESDLEQSLLQDASDLFDFSSDIVVKEEPVEQPTIYPAPTVSNSFSAVSQYSQKPPTPPIRNVRCSRRTTVADSKRSKPTGVSKAALKMRAYRERLKQPENFHRYLRHQQQQREWNKRHYVKKQTMTGKSPRQRRGRGDSVNFYEDYEDSNFAVIVDAN